MAKRYQNVYNFPMARERMNEVVAEKYFQEVPLVNLQVPEKEIMALYSVMGLQPNRPLIPDTPLKTSGWIDSSAKRRMEIAFALIVLNIFGGHLFIEHAIQKIETIDGPPGLIDLEFGFFGEKSGIISTTVQKIRTMIRDAQSAINSPFGQTTFQAGSSNRPLVEDRRIIDHPYPKSLRRSGKDELPQLLQITKMAKRREFLLAGVRGYTTEGTFPEIDGIIFLHQYRNDNRLSPYLTPTAARILEVHSKMVDIVKPIGALVSPLSAYRAKDTPHMVRMLGDILYWKYASPRVDFAIFYNSIIRRIQGVGAR